jgi:hypothetical protein
MNAFMQASIAFRCHFLFPVSCRQDTGGHMKSDRINIQRAALFGLFFGMAFGVIDSFSELSVASPARTIGRLIGSGFAGAFLFAGVAAVANLFRK